MKIRHAIALIAITLTATGASAMNDWNQIFDGTTLDGWSKHGGGATFEVIEEVIIGANGPGHNTFLCTEKAYADFELEFDVMLAEGLNSGVQIRSQTREENKDGEPIEVIYGPQVEIDGSSGMAGYIYGERVGGWMTADADRVKHEAFVKGEWNQYRVKAHGPRIQTWINGKQIADLYHPEKYNDHKKGFIGLQVHSSPAAPGTQKVAWKNIRIREIDTEGYVSLFNGKNLDGWTPKVKGFELGENPGDIFRVEDSVIKVRYDKFDNFGDRFGHLFCNKPFSKYIFRMEYRFVGQQAPGGPGWAYRNSGIMAHGQAPETMGKDQDFPNSIEVQLLGADEGKVRTTANLCTPGTQFVQDGAVIKTHCVNSKSQSYAGDQWVQIEILVDGSKEIAHFINGDEVMRYQQPQLDNGQLIEGGSISLQAESHSCEFRNIEIKDLSQQ